MNSNNNIPIHQTQMVSPWKIALCFSLWFLVIPPIIGIAFIFKLKKQQGQLIEAFNNIDGYRMEADAYAYNVRNAADEYSNNARSEADNNAMAVMNQANEYFNAKHTEADSYYDSVIKDEKARLDDLCAKVTEENFVALQEKITASEKKISNAAKKVENLSYLYKAIVTFIKRFRDSSASEDEVARIERLIEQTEVENLMDPTVEMKLHSDDIKELRRKFREVNKTIDETLTSYESRYNTKANVAIYRLMVVALRSELQNVLYTLKFGNLEDAENAKKEKSDKY